MRAKPDEDRSAYWFAACRWTDGDRSRLKAVRDVTLASSARACWPLVRVELAAATTRADAGDPARWAIGVLLDCAFRLAPDGYPRLLGALVSSSGGAPDLAQVGALWAAFEPVLAAFGAAPGASADVVPAEARLADDPAHLRRQGEAILAYRDKSLDLERARAGIAAAMVWASQPKRRERLAAIAGLHATSLFADGIVLLVLAALRMRRDLAARGLAWPLPDVAVMDVPPHALGELVLAWARRPTPEPQRAAPPELPPDVGTSESWWQGARVWARGSQRKLADLLEVAEHLPRSLPWSLVREAAERLSAPRALREPELARIALGSFLDEFLRAFPGRYGDLLNLVATEADAAGSRRPHDRVGRVWQLCEGLFAGWARTLDPSLGPKEAHRIVKVLHQEAGMLPWHEAEAKSRSEREKLASRLIDAVYHDDTRDPEQVRQAIYWAATTARNDLAHEGPSKLKGRVPHADLMRDTIALMTLAAMRFKLRLARDGAAATVPEFRCIERPPPGA
ncbi:MAG: hypothetical protein IT385_26130 [Deltaproteobacteria bacterium]|nr:hypothetical protein [Deltaproteobacteria bacterium]